MISIFWGILATVGILGIVFAIIHFSSKKAAPPTTGATTSSGRLTDWAGWGKLQDNFAIPVALVLILGACWLAWPKQFNQAATNPGFWAGMILVILVGGILLRATVPFKDSWIRKILLAGSFFVGITLIIGSFIPWDKLEAFSQQQSLAPQVIHRNVTPNDWCDWIFIPPGDKFTMKIPGRVRIKFRTGEEKEISPNDSLGIMPHQQFRLKGVGISGIAVITIG